MPAGAKLPAETPRLDPARSRRALLLAAITLAWAGTVYAAFRPGLMSVDALVHYGQGLQNAYSNQHPPLVSMLFGLSGRWLGTPAGILALQLATIGGGFALLAWRAVRTPARSKLPFAVVVAFLAVPTTWALAAVLGKDALLVGALLLASAALRAGRPGVAFALALAGTLVRHNAILATAPLAIGAAWECRRLRSRSARALAAAAALAVLAAAPKGVERLAGARDVWPVGQLLVYDLAGIYVRHPEALPASALSRDVTPADLERLYTPLTGGPLEFPADAGDPGVPFEHLAERRHELSSEWLRAVRTYPGAYLAHRWAVFRALLGLYRGPVFYPFHTRIEPNPWGLGLPPGTPVSRALVRVRDAAKDTILFRGGLWVALATVATALAASRARRDRVPLWIAASGLAYALAYAAISVSAELRYVYWTAVSPFATAAAALGAAAPAGAGAAAFGAAAGASPSGAPPTARGRPRSGRGAPGRAEPSADR
jgi:hypothetical protein